MSELLEQKTAFNVRLLLPRWNLSCACISLSSIGAAATAAAGTAVTAAAAGKAQALGYVLQSRPWREKQCSLQQRQRQRREQQQHQQQHQAHLQLPPRQPPGEFRQHSPQLKVQQQEQHQVQRQHEHQKQDEGERQHEAPQHEGQRQPQQQPHRLHRWRRGCSYLFLREAKGESFESVLRLRQQLSSKQQQQHGPKREQKRNLIQQQQQQQPLDAHTKLQQQRQLHWETALQHQQQHCSHQQLSQESFPQWQLQQIARMRSNDCVRRPGVQRALCTSSCLFPSSSLPSSFFLPVPAGPRPLPLVSLEPPSFSSPSSCRSTSYIPFSSVASFPAFPSSPLSSASPPFPTSPPFCVAPAFCLVSAVPSFAAKFRPCSTSSQSLSSGELQRLFQREMREWFVQKKQGTHWHMWYPPGILFSNTRHQKRGVVTPPLPQWYFPCSSSSASPAAGEASVSDSDIPFSSSFSSPPPPCPSSARLSFGPSASSPAEAAAHFAGGECHPASSPGARGPTPLFAGCSPESYFSSDSCSLSLPISSSSRPSPPPVSSASFSFPPSSSALCVPSCTLSFLTHSKASVAFLLQQVLLHPQTFYVAVAPDYDICFLLLRLAVRAFGMTPWKMAFFPNLRILCTHPLHVPAFIPNGLLSEVYIHLVDVHAAVRRFCTSRCPLLSPTFLPQLHAKLHSDSNIYVFVETPSSITASASSPRSSSCLQRGEKSSTVSDCLQPPSLHVSSSSASAAASAHSGDRARLGTSRSSSSSSAGAQGEDHEDEGREKMALHLLLQLLQQTTAATGLRDFRDTPLRRKRAAAFAAAAASGLSISSSSAAVSFPDFPADAASAVASGASAAAGIRPPPPDLLQLLLPSHWAGSCVRVEETAGAAAAASHGHRLPHCGRQRRPGADLLFALETGEDSSFSLYLARVLAAHQRAQHQLHLSGGEKQQQQQHARQQQEKAQLQQQQQRLIEGDEEDGRRLQQEEEYDVMWEGELLEEDAQEAAEGWMGVGPLKSFSSILRKEVQQLLQRQQPRAEEQPRPQVEGWQQRLELQRQQQENFTLRQDGGGGDSSDESQTDTVPAALPQRLLLSEEVGREGGREETPAGERNLSTAEQPQKDGVQQQSCNAFFSRTPMHAAEVGEARGSDREGETDDRRAAEDHWEEGDEKVERQRGRREEEDEWRGYRGVSEVSNTGYDSAETFAAAVRRKKEGNAMALPSGGVVVFVEKEEDPSSFMSEQQLQRRYGNGQQQQQHNNNVHKQLLQQREKQQRQQQAQEELQQKPVRLEAQWGPQQEKQQRPHQLQQDHGEILEPERQQQQKQEDRVFSKLRQEQQVPACEEALRRKTGEERLGSNYEPPLLRQQASTIETAAAAVAAGVAQQQEWWQHLGGEEVDDYYCNTAKQSKKSTANCAAGSSSADCSSANCSRGGKKRSGVEGERGIRSRERNSSSSNSNSRNRAVAVAGGSASFAWVKLKKLAPQLPNFRFLLYRV